MKSVFFYSVIWFGVLVLMFVFTAPLADYLMMFMPLAFLFMEISGFVLALLALYFLWSGTRRAGTILAICVLGLTLYYSNIGFKYGRVALFQIRKPEYVKQLANAEKIGVVPEGVGLSDDGPNQIHGFYWQRGLLDNYSVVVYDPTGQIASINDDYEANGMDGVHSNPLSELFGGTYYRCQAVGGGWYICWFT